MLSELGLCPMAWDGLACWDATAAGEVARQPCPGYIAGFDPQVSQLLLENISMRMQPTDWKLVSLSQCRELLFLPSPVEYNVEGRPMFCALILKCF